MKKLLLTMFAAVAALAASATTVTYDFINNTYGMERLSGTTSDYNASGTLIENEAAVITTSGNTRLWADGLRLYKESGFTVSVNGGGTVSEIVITFKNNAALKGVDLVAGQAGTYAAAAGDAPVEATWTGSAASVAFTANISKSNLAISTIKVTYEGGTVDTRKDADLSFSESKIELTLGDAFTAPTLTKATNAAITYSSDAETVATVDATTGAVTILAAGSARITAKAEANTEYRAGEASYLIVVKEPAAPADITVVKATTFEPGEYAFIFAEGYITAIAENKTYGYPMAVAATLADEMMVSKDAIFKFTAADDAYGITDCYGRYMGWDGSHGSFNLYTAITEGSSYWTVTLENGLAKIVNKADKDGAEVYIAGKTYNSDFELVPTWTADQTLPYLYKVKDNESGINEVEVETAAPAVYYNLQGVKVANPENGLYIKVQGGKTSKVLVK